MVDELAIQCARCAVPKGKRACDSVDGAAPRGCPTRKGRGAIDAGLEVLAEPEVRRFAQLASRQEAESYTDRGAHARPTLTGVEEVCALARRAGWRRLGVALCAGLIVEAEVLDRILVAHGFEVLSVICKVGAVAKEELGLTDAEKIRPGTFEAMCNPIGQAELLNRCGTELNILLGLCVGHDALFLRHATAPCTVLAVKDRVLGHNPVAALYTSGSCSRHLLDPAGLGRSAPSGDHGRREGEGGLSS